MKHEKISLTAIAASGVPLPKLETKDAPDIEEVLAEHIKTVGKALANLKDSDKTAEERMSELQGELTELSQKMAQGRRSESGFMGGNEQRSLGEQFADADGLDEFAGPTRKHAGSFAIETKAAITSAPTSAGALALPGRDQLVMIPRRRMRIRSLMRVIGTASGIVQVPYQKSRQLNAAPVAQMALKPESDMAFDLRDVPVRTIAHWVAAAKQILADAPQLAGLIDGDLVYGLDLVEEAQLLYGDGEDENLRGMVPQATPFNAPFAIANATMIDRIGLAILQSSLTDVEPDGVVVHPSDWMRIRLTKDADGNYVYGPPGVQVTPVIFGLPVVPTPSMSVDKFLTGPFGDGATIYDRETTTVIASDQDRDNFVRNKVTILAERRLGFDARRPASFVYGDFGNVA